MIWINSLSGMTPTILPSSTYSIDKSINGPALIWTDCLETSSIGTTNLLVSFNSMKTSIFYTPVTLSACWTSQPTFLSQLRWSRITQVELQMASSSMPRRGTTISNWARPSTSQLSSRTLGRFRTKSAQRYNMLTWLSTTASRASSTWICRKTAIVSN